VACQRLRLGLESGCQARSIPSAGRLSGSSLIEIQKAMMAAKAASRLQTQKASQTADRHRSVRPCGWRGMQLCVLRPASRWRKTYQNWARSRSTPAYVKSPSLVTRNRAEKRGLPVTLVARIGSSGSPGENGSFCASVRVPDQKGCRVVYPRVRSQATLQSRNSGKLDTSKNVVSAAD
jgi:hypothetical protein